MKWSIICFAIYHVGDDVGHMMYNVYDIKLGSNKEFIDSKQ